MTATPNLRQPRSYSPLALEFMDASCSSMICSNQISAPFPIPRYSASAARNQVKLSVPAVNTFVAAAGVCNVDFAFLYRVAVAQLLVFTVSILRLLPLPLVFIPDSPRFCAQQPPHP